MRYFLLNPAFKYENDPDPRGAICTTFALGVGGAIAQNLNSNADQNLTNTFAATQSGVASMPSENAPSTPVTPKAGTGAEGGGGSGGGGKK